MHALSSLFLFGTCAFQAVQGRPNVSRSKHDNGNSTDSLDSFIEKEIPTAMGLLVCNIGSTGCAAAGASPGSLIASPSKDNPDYFYTWIRDSALVFKQLTDMFVDGYNNTLQSQIQDYITAQAILQSVPNPSGTLDNGSGLGEPKFYSNLTAFLDQWGRPQPDGPALRATTLIAYANWLVANNFSSTASDMLWPIIRNDLSFVAQYWNMTAFEAWEEIKSSSFFTTANQHRALVQGSQLAALLGEECTACDPVASQILCFLQNYWSPSGYIPANINLEYDRTGKDSITLISTISTFDPAVKCDAATFQPCSDKALANHKAVTDSFRSVYGINKGIPQGSAVAVGRYAEDNYRDGNPWYLSTLAAAEQLYDALIVWKSQGFIEVTSISLAFFQDLDSSVVAGTYQSDSSTYKSLLDAVSAYADGYMNIVATYAAPNGSLSEQFGKSDGHPLSAYDLSWSYSAFLSAASRRAGTTPPPWVGESGNIVPDVCTDLSVAGTYEKPPVPTFPGSQYPGEGNSTAAGATSGACPSAKSILVTFNEIVTTMFGDTILLVGSIPELGNWNISKAKALNANKYTADNNLWRVTVALPLDVPIEYKFVNVLANGTISWEADPNHSVTLKEPEDGSQIITIPGTWQKPS